MGRGDWGDYWRRVCAPKLLAKKKELGRAVPEREIALYVERTTGKPSERSLVWMWLHGEREPFISQFFALCSKLEIDPIEVLAPPMAKQPPAGVLRGSGKGLSQRRERKTA
jgi:hypothetical protein